MLYVSMFRSQTKSAWTDLLGTLGSLLSSSHLIDDFSTKIVPWVSGQGKGRCNHTINHSCGERGIKIRAPVVAA
jgi:hypothetical protein